MGRLRRLRDAVWVTWLWSGAVDQALGIYEMLPERSRAWIEGAIIAKFVAALVTAGIIFWGVLRDVDPLWLTVAAIIVLAGTTVVVQGLQGAIDSIKQSAFDVVPVSSSGTLVGIGDDLFKPDRVYARIGVQSHRDVRSCVAVVTGVSVYQKYAGMVSLLWNARYLAWTPEENLQRQATVLKGITMTADLAVCTREEPHHFQVTSADEGARHKFPRGLYKIDVTVLSESGGGARRDVSMSLLHELTPGVDEPMRRLVVQPWRDEFAAKRLDKDRAELEKKQDERAGESSEAS